MKSLVMGLFLLSISLGDMFTAAVNVFIQNKDGTTKLSGVNYYLFFAGLMFATALLFIVVAKLYRGQTFIQGDEEVPAATAA
jgi:POT family proton-dependent oligopeptide transporter